MAMLLMRIVGIEDGCEAQYDAGEQAQGRWQLWSEVYKYVYECMWLYVNAYPIGNVGCGLCDLEILISFLSRFNENGVLRHSKLFLL